MADSEASIGIPGPVLLPPQIKSITEEPKKVSFDLAGTSISSGPKLSTSISGAPNYEEESRALLHEMSGQIPNGPAILAFLQGTDHLFLKKCNEFPAELLQFKPVIKREVWNSSCRTIYFAGQLPGKWKLFGSEFFYQVQDYTGRMVLTIHGSQIGCGMQSSAKIMLGDKDGTTLGIVAQDFCDASYTISNPDGKKLYRIQGPCFGSCAPCVFWSCDEQFEINMADGVSEVGLVKTHWKDTHPDAAGIFGVSFPTKLDTNDKALLLGAAFLIHYQYFRRGGNGVLVCLLYLLIIAAIVVLLGRYYFDWISWSE